MTYEDVIEYYGSVREAASRLGYVDRTVRYWRERGIEKRTQQYIQYRTRGRLRADE